MRHYKVSALLNLDAPSYFAERDSLAFRKMAAQALKLEGMEVDSTWQEGGCTYVRMTTTPSWRHYMPRRFAPIARKHVGNKLVYTDILEYDPLKTKQPPYELAVTTVPPMFRKKAHFRSRLVIEEAGPGRCRQTLEGELHLRVGLGLGSLAERVTVAQLCKVYRRLPALVDRWVDFRNEVLSGPNPHDILTAGRPALLPHLVVCRPRPSRGQLPWPLRPVALPWRPLPDADKGACADKEAAGPGWLLGQRMPWPPRLPFWEGSRPNAKP